jgi:hypothetical protein
MNANGADSLKSVGAWTRWKQLNQQLDAIRPPTNVRITNLKEIDMPRKLNKIQCPFCEKKCVSQGLSPHVKSRHPLEFAIWKEMFPNVKLMELDWNHIDVINNYAAHSVGLADLKQPIEVTPEPPLQAQVLSIVEQEIIDLDANLLHFSLDQLIEIFSGILRRRLRTISDEIGKQVGRV